DPGMALLLLHPLGTLDHMEIQPSYDPETGPAIEPAPGPASEPQAASRAGDEEGDSTGGSDSHLPPPRGPPATPFEAVARAAGLDPSRLHPKPAAFPPPFFADERAAYRGNTAQRPELTLEIRMAGYQGRPVFFRMAPETSGESDPAEEGLLESLLADWQGMADWQDLWVLIWVASLVAAILMARRNLRRGRGDRRGARRLAVVVFVTFGLLWILRSPHFRDLSTEWTMAQVRLGQSMLNAAMAWVFYLALEPYVRRLWPRTLISWTRLFHGRYYDPLVGRAVLVGVVFGIAWTLIGQLDQLLPLWLGWAHEPPPVAWQQFDYALGVSSSLAGIVELAYGALFDSVFSLLLLVLLRLLLGRESFAVGAYVALVAAMYSHEGVHPHISWLTMGLTFAATEALVLVRFGLVTYATAIFAYSLLAYYPLTLEVSAWYAKTGYSAIATVALLASVATYFALARRRLGASSPDPVSRRTASRSGDSLTG
ncbi:MAG: hypothetical protein MI919_14010, partial [Holophagales bacterium]|nr:hypothetical protein [Holophagales bacterium]